MIQSCKLNTAFGIAEINTNIVESNPPSELLTSAAVGNLFTRCQRVVRKPIRYVTIHFQDRSGAASFRCKNRAEISDPFVNRGPIRYGFCVGAQAIRYSVDIALDSRTRTTTSTRFSHRTTWSARKPTSFWREKRDTVANLVRRFGKMLSSQNKSRTRQ